MSKCLSLAVAVCLATSAFAQEDAPREPCADTEYFTKGACQALTMCGATEAEVIPPTEFSNRECSPLNEVAGPVNYGRPGNAGAVTQEHIENCVDAAGPRSCNWGLQRTPGFCQKANAAARCARTCGKTAGCPCFDGPFHTYNANKVISTLDCRMKLASWPEMCVKASGEKSINGWAAQCPFTCGTCSPSLADFDTCADTTETSVCVNKLSSWSGMCAQTAGRWRNACRKTCNAC